MSSHVIVSHATQLPSSLVSGRLDVDLSDASVAGTHLDSMDTNVAAMESWLEKNDAFNIIATDTIADTTTMRVQSIFGYDSVNNISRALECDSNGDLAVTNVTAETSLAAIDTLIQSLNSCSQTTYTITEQAANSSDLSTGIDVSDFKRVELVVESNVASAGDIVVGIEWSPDDTNWYFSPFNATLTNVTDAAGATQTVGFMSENARMKWVRVHVRNNGVTIPTSVIIVNLIC